MPVPTAEVSDDFHSPLMNSDGTDDYYALYNAEETQHLPRPYSEQNMVVVQVNPGETFTIQNEDGTCRNIPGPAQVPMISQNGAIPPIFVPPGYISQVFEENGVRHVVVLPNTMSNAVENNQSDVSTPPIHGPAFHHHPMFHYPPVPHLQYPMNGFHHTHLHPAFMQHQNLTMIPNYHPEAMPLSPRSVYTPDAGNPCCVTPPWQLPPGVFLPDLNRHCTSLVNMQPQPVQQQQPAYRAEYPGEMRTVSPVSQGATPANLSSQMKIVFCAFSPHGEMSEQPCDSELSERTSVSDGLLLPPGSSCSSASNVEHAQDGTLSDSAYNSMHHSCMSDTPLSSPPLNSFQPCPNEHPPAIPEQSANQSASDSPPGTSSITSSPDSASSCSSSPPGSPLDSRHSPLANGRELTHSPVAMEDEEMYRCNSAGSNLNGYHPYDIQESRLDSTMSVSNPASSEDDEARLSADARHDSCREPESKCLETVKELLATLKKPEIRELKSRSTRVVWNSLAIGSTSASLKQKLSRSSVTFDLHLASRKREGTKFSSVYSGADCQFVIPDLRPATDYAVRLCAIFDCEKSAPTAVTSFRTLASVPDTPGSPTLQLKSKNFLILRWKAPHDNGEKIQKYHVEVSQGQSVERLRSVQTSVEKQFVVQKLLPARFYAFKLAAENKIGKSSWSPKVTYSTFKNAPPAPSPPRVVKINSKNLILAWDGSPVDITGFTLEMNTETSAYGFRPVYNGPDLKCTVKLANRNSNYEFRLQAYVANERSPYSEVVCFSEKPIAPPKPRVKGTVKSRSCGIAWESPGFNTALKVSKYVVDMSSNKVDTVKQVYTGTAHECLLDSLEPGCSYRLRLTCFFNVGTVSPPSDALVIDTPPAIPGCCLPPVLARRPEVNSLTIEWESPTDSDSAVATGYEVNCIATCDVCKREPFQAYRGSNTECTVENLLPGTKYSFYVRAFNSVGVGPWSDSLEVITRANAPGKVETPIATVFGPNAVHLQWRNPPDNGAEIINYRLRWGLSEDSMTPMLIGAVLVHEFQRLVPNTSYYYSLQAVNNVGSGPVSDTGKVCTSCAAPETVSAVRLPSDDAVSGDRSTASVTASQITISWKPPCDNGSTIIGYKIHTSEELQSDDDDLTPSSDLTLVDASSSRSTIEGLKPNTAYSIKVCAYNLIGCGCFSAPLRVQTKPLPSPAPTLLCSLLSYSSLQLEWVDSSKVKGDVQYLLQKRDKHGRFITLYQGPSTMKKVTKLSENTSYSFRVITVGPSEALGNGRNSKVQTFTTPYHLPTVAVPVVSNVTATSCDVTWPSCGRIKNGAIFYRVHLKLCDDQDADEQIHSSDKTCYSFSNLTPNTKYRLFVCAVRHRAATSNPNQNPRDGRRVLNVDSLGSESSDLDLPGPPSTDVIFTTFNRDDGLFSAPTSPSTPNSPLKFDPINVGASFLNSTNTLVKKAVSQSADGDQAVALFSSEQVYTLKYLLFFFLASALSSYVLFACVN